MNYTVVWVHYALDQLAEVWNTAADRNAVAAASHRIDTRLTADPRNEGESRCEGERILIDPPLQVLFRVSEPERLVEVTEVARFGRRRG